MDLPGDFRPYLSYLPYSISFAINREIIEEGDHTSFGKTDQPFIHTKRKGVDPVSIPVDSGVTDPRSYPYSLVGQ